MRLIDHPTREASAGWKGGRSQQQGGRRLIFLGKDHPMAYANGYALEHRLVMATAIGRFLRPGEHVHHIDLDPTNNSPENLVILTRSQHSRLHRLIDKRGLTPLEALAEAAA